MVPRAAPGSPPGGAVLRQLSGGATILVGLFMLGSIGSACSSYSAGTASLLDGGTADGGGSLDAGPPTDGGGTQDGGSSWGSGESSTVVIGPAGGEVRLANAVIVLPAGALSTPTAITVTETTMTTPAGYRAFSPLYRFEPQGLVFSAPLRVSLRSHAAGGDVPRAALFWSQTGALGGGWQRIGGVASGGTVSGDVTHFSFGFIADGVDYTEPPNRTCVRTRVLDSRALQGSGVGVFFSLDDCWGRPITDLQESELQIFEDDVAVSSEAGYGLFERRGLQVFVTLAIDVSASTRAILGEVIGAAQAFVQTLNDPARGLRDRVHVAVLGFAGESGAAGFYQRHTVDLELVLTRLSELAAYVPMDSNSTNLHGAVTAALSVSGDVQRGFVSRNRGGAFATGYVVLFTDGVDTADRVSFATARSAIEMSADDVIAIGLRGRDYDPAVLRRLVGDVGLYEAESRTALDREFRHIGARIAGQVRRTYLLGYCSPKRSGQHTVKVGIRGAEMRTLGAPPTFTADGFGGGCTPERLNPANSCRAASCGGFGCGACDDRLGLCDANASPTVGGTCVSHCLLQNACSGQTIMNVLGYGQVCAPSVEATLCSGRCSNLLHDDRNCGACGSRCFCEQGACVGVAQLSLDVDHSCARLANGRVRCWGDNRFGQLGDGSTTQRLTPVAVAGISSATQISSQKSGAAGRSVMCARLSDGRVQCWGRNDLGAVGDGTSTDRHLPTAVTNLVDVASISTGDGTACAVMTGGGVRCWGSLAPGSTGRTTVPSDAPDLATVSQIVFGPSPFAPNCVVQTSGSVRCWGSNRNGQIGDGTMTERLTPVESVAVVGLSDVVELAVGTGRTCARIGTDGTVRCWGSGGTLGNGSTSPSYTPTTASSISGALQLSMGHSHTCALIADGIVKCWGGNSFGMVGDGSTTTRLTAVEVQDLRSVTQISAGNAHTCALRDDGTAYCWGGNHTGAVGDGTTTNRPTPVRIEGLSGVAEIVAHNQRTCAVLADGGLYCWGGGYLGDGTATGSLTPVRVP